MAALVQICSTLATLGNQFNHFEASAYHNSQTFHSDVGSDQIEQIQDPKNRYYKQYNDDVWIEIIGCGSRDQFLDSFIALQASQQVHEIKHIGVPVNRTFFLAPTPNILDLLKANPFREWEAYSIPPIYVKEPYNVYANESDFTFLRCSTLEEFNQDIRKIKKALKGYHGTILHVNLFGHGYERLFPLFGTGSITGKHLGKAINAIARDHFNCTFVMAPICEAQSIIDDAAREAKKTFFLSPSYFSRPTRTTTEVDTISPNGAIIRMAYACPLCREFIRVFLRNVSCTLENFAIQFPQYSQENGIRFLRPFITFSTDFANKPHLLAFICAAPMWYLFGVPDQGFPSQTLKNTGSSSLPRDEEVGSHVPDCNNVYEVLDDAEYHANCKDLGPNTTEYRRKTNRYPKDDLIHPNGPIIPTVAPTPSFPYIPQPTITPTPNPIDL